MPLGVMYTEKLHALLLLFYSTRCTSPRQLDAASSWFARYMFTRHISIYCISVSAIGQWISAAILAAAVALDQLHLPAHPAMLHFLRDGYHSIIAFPLSCILLLCSCGSVEIGKAVEKRWQYIKKPGILFICDNLRRKFSSKNIYDNKKFFSPFCSKVYIIRN